MLWTPNNENNKSVTDKIECFIVERKSVTAMVKVWQLSFSWIIESLIKQALRVTLNKSLRFFTEYC